MAIAFAIMLCPSFEAGAKSNASRQATAAIQFSHKHAFYETPFDLALSSSILTSRIYYTTNGTVPTVKSGRLYDRPVKIDSTTIVRAVLIGGDGSSGRIETRTYLFTRDVLRQTGAGLPPTWGMNKGKAVPADYEMDPKLVNHPDYRDSMAKALKSIPSLSIVMEQSDLFDPVHGIYANAQETGAESERAASVELIYPEGFGGFEIGCGIRVQGGWNRRPEESPKHSFRLIFKQKYGSASLESPLFGEAGGKEFETIVLRSGNNNSWLHWSGEERRRADFIRDQWMRDTMRAMGHASPRGLFAHLYLNGLYWGLYNVCERPAAGFASAHFGGSPKDYDSRNADKILEGDNAAWRELFALANQGLNSDEAFRAIQEVLDLPSFIDYMIANLYGANADWDRSSNWYAARLRKPPGKFRFFVWDGERTLEKVDDNRISFDDDQSPPRLFQKLRTNPEFRLQFADHIHRHFFDRGCLAPEPAAERFQVWAKTIETAVIAESARWGDYRRDVHQYKTGPYELYTRNEHWRPEIERLLTEYFPKRTAAALQQFREAGLYPKTDAPTGELIGSGWKLSAPNGIIYFTIDGSDPRLPANKLSPVAVTFTSAIPQGKTIKCRAVTGSPESGEWSALAEFGTTAHPE